MTKHQLRFPKRDVDIREVCGKMLGLSKSSVRRLYPQELILLCKGRGYLK